MIDPKLEIFVDDYITIRGSKNFYKVVGVVDREFPDPPKYLDYVIEVDGRLRMVSRSLIKGVISKEAMLQKQNKER